MLFKDSKNKESNFPKKRMSNLNITLIIGFVLFVGLLFISWGIKNPTGYAVNEVSDRINLENINLIGDQQFKIIEVKKDINSMLNLDIKSDFNTNIFVEINDCSYWKAGNDRDNQVLYAISNIKEGNFNVGDPSLKTLQQIELYKSNYLCLIVINKEFQNGNSGVLSMKVDQLDKDKWTII